MRVSLWKSVSICIILGMTALASFLAGEGQALSQTASRQRAVMVFGGSCLAIGLATYLEAPMVDGQPDLKHAEVHKLLVTPKCGQIRVDRN